MNKFTFIIALWLLFISSVQAAQLTAVRVEDQHTSARLIFSLTTPTPYRWFLLSKPERLVIDFQETHLQAALNKTPLLPAYFTQLRNGYPAPKTLRIVISLGTKAHFKIFAAPQKQAQLIVEFAAPHFTQTTPIHISPHQHSTVIVLDAGHGGKDPGAIGIKGTAEKNITLAIARELAKLINQQPGMRAVLTRRGDYFVPLRNRLKLARKGNADLFIAIHADSYFNNEAGGASIFALSQHGATTEAAHWLARRDNYSELGSVDLRELEDQSYVLRSVLIDLAQTATITDSLRLGNILLTKLNQVTHLHYTRVEQAPFMVLKSPDIPSVLIETGFLSNPHEEQRLRDTHYQMRMAQAIFAGLQNYLKN